MKPMFRQHFTPRGIVTDEDSFLQLHTIQYEEFFIDVKWADE